MGLWVDLEKCTSLSDIDEAIASMMCVTGFGDTFNPPYIHRTSGIPEHFAGPEPYGETDLIAKHLGLPGYIMA